MSMTSNGEIYQINFGYNPKDSMTYVSVEVSLAFGYGVQWRKPQKIMKRWAHMMGTPPMNLVRNIDNRFYEILNEIRNESRQPQIDSSKKYCPNCGKENKISDKFCIQCGSSLVF
jgi:hypothetical protein